MNRNILMTLLAALVLVVFSQCGVLVRGTIAGYELTEAQFYQGRHKHQLDTEEVKWAKAAWKYFELNKSAIGLVPSKAGYPVANMKDMADYMAAIVSAYELKLINKIEFDRRMTALISFLGNMHLFNGQLPNKLYNTDTGEKVNYSNKHGEIGWSAMDIGRLLVWLKIVRENYVQYAEYVDKVIVRWDFCDVIDTTGIMYGASRENDSSEIHKYQEGRLGSEEYAAKGFQAWGFNTTLASKFEPMSKISVYNTELFFDTRDPRGTGGTINIESEPFIWDGLEFNWVGAGNTKRVDCVRADKRSRSFAHNVYKVQELRYKNEHIFTARANQQMEEDPYMLYDGIFINGYLWNTMGADGTFHSDKSIVSTKAAFGLWVLWKTRYTTQLMKVVNTLYDPDKGWFEGRYEKQNEYNKTLTTATNAMILATLYYKTHGKLYHLTTDNSYYEILLNNTFNRPRKCFPTVKPKK